MSNPSYRRLRAPAGAVRLGATLLSALLLLAILAGLVWFDNTANRGITYTPDPEPIPFASGPELGVNLYNLPYEPDPAVIPHTFAVARDLGARYARIQAPWEDIEIHGRGDFSDRRNLDTVGEVSAWAKYDRIVAAAVEADIELIIRLERPPAWARQQFIASPYFQAGLAVDGNSTGPPDSLEDFASFVRAIVGRYKGQVSYFQIWNEPNLKNEWNWQTPRPEDFAELLKVGYTAAKEANPDVVILFPGLAPTDGLDDRAPMTELEYLDRIYAVGGAAYFDIMSAQSYGLGQSPEEHRYIFLRNRGNWNWRQPIDTRNDVSRVVLLREVMERNGDAATPVWVTEFGWNSAPDSIPPERRFTWGEPVSEQLKGEYIIAQMERARQEWPWMGAMNVWMLRYGGYAEPDPNDPTPYFALVSRDWQEQPSYQLVKDYLAQPARLGVGAFSWDHPAVTPVDGGWQVQFSGARITLVGGLDGGIEAQIDGQATSLVRDGLDGKQTLSSSWLGSGDHTLFIRGDAPPEWLIVEQARPLGWLWDYAPLVLLLALGLNGALLMPQLFGVADAAWGWYRREQRQSAGQRGWYAALLRRETLLLLGMALSLIIGYRLSPQIPLTLFGLALFGLLACWRPDLGLLFVPCTVALHFMPKNIFDERFGIRDSGLSLPLHELVLLMVLGATLLHFMLVELRPLIATKRYRQLFGFLDRSLLLPAGLFALLGVWGVIVADDRSTALRELRWLIIEPLMFLALLFYHAQRHQVGYWRLVIFFWLGGGALAGLVGVLQVLGYNLAPLIGTKVGFGEDMVAVEGVRRATGLYGHPNNLGLILGRMWPIGAALAHGVFWGQPQARFGQRLLRASPYLLITALCLGGLLASFSRGAYLGAAAAGLVLGLLLLPRQWFTRQRVIIGVGGIVGLGLLGVLGIVLLDIERFNLFGGSSSIRVQTWLSALAMLRDHPLGIGLDQFGRLYPSYIAPELAGTNEINTAHPHNLLLDIPLRLSPLGLLGFGWLLWWFYRRVWPTTQPQALTEAQAAQSPLSRNGLWAIGPGLLAAMVAALAHGLVDAFYFWPDLAFAFWILLALASASATWWRTLGKTNT